MRLRIRINLMSPELLLPRLPHGPGKQFHHRCNERDHQQQCPKSKLQPHGLPISRQAASLPARLRDFQFLAKKSPQIISILSHSPAIFHMKPSRSLLGHQMAGQPLFDKPTNKTAAGHIPVCPEIARPALSGTGFAEKSSRQRAHRNRHKGTIRPFLN